ncbi:nitrate/nitrite transport system permease protein [Sphingobium sp. OAS761]|uniref:ABC transporter permease n=1 Tax=Sphingobium sp. OAS761 TaxID=2817901 RepID=UPI00209D9650|nr:ABC transporter permease [Sphingobium sp. OAS761]MCP1471618.1 nitrate/nitrite transport system permease protein [Sphingobium sp. OAS761]
MNQMTALRADRGNPDETLTSGPEAVSTIHAPPAVPEENPLTRSTPPAWMRRFIPSGSDIAKAAKSLIAPVAGIVLFLTLWAVLAPQVQTSLGALPGPVAVAEQAGALYDDYRATEQAKADFYAQQDARNQALIAAGRPAEVQNFPYSGAPTFIDQIITSLETVALGFLLATVVAVPLGLVCGLSKRINAAINPLVQIFKPVSPLAWLPIVTMVISATMTSPDPMLPKSFVISAIVVMLCSLWPTLINTSVGASSIDKDLLNVGRVLRLSWGAQLTRLILPSSLPYIFTGMRLSLGVGWMVLIAAEMLAQNPGLGKFVWDEFQNGSSQSLSRIMLAVIIIGFIGFALDRLMGALQAFASRNHKA